MFAVTAGREGTHAGLAEPRPDCLHDTGLVPNHHLATAAVGFPSRAAFATTVAVIRSEIAVCESRLGLTGETASRAVLVRRVLRRLERAGRDRSP